MKSLAGLVFLFIAYTSAYAQSADELFDKGDFEALAKLGNQADKLTNDELYKVGYAFFRLEKDEKAVEFYDKAIAKGLDEDYVHFYKGLSLRYLKKYDEALREIEIALKSDPSNQEYVNEKGMVYYVQEKYDRALEIFEGAKSLPATFPEPFYWAARIYHIKNDYKKALAGYYEASQKIPKENYYYEEALISIGQLEYTFTKDFLKSAKAYDAAIEVDPENYELFYKLMKSYNAAKKYPQADSVFALVKTAFEQKKLPEEDMEIKTVAVAQFEWNGQTAVIRRSLVDPKELLDISYKVFLLNKEGDAVERKFMVEKTLQIDDDGIKHLLCEQDKQNGRHLTYPYGWTTDVIPLDSLEEAVKKILDGKMKAAASSGKG